MPADIITLAPANPNTLRLDRPYGWFKDLDRVIGKFPSTDEARPLLGCVHICTIDGKLRFEATDSYRLIQLDTEIVHDDRSLDLTVPWAWMQRVLRACSYRASFVTLSIDASSVIVTNNLDTFSVSHAQGSTFPPFKHLVDVPELPQLEPAAFNPLLLHDLTTALVQAERIQLWQMTAMKPLMVKVKYERLGANGVAALMPVRVQ